MPHWGVTFPQGKNGVKNGVKTCTEFANSGCLAQNDKDDAYHFLPIGTIEVAQSCTMAWPCGNPGGFGWKFWSGMGV